MHTPLAPHLHTDDCNKLIGDLMQCHQDNNIVKQWFGACNGPDWAMRRCLKAERLEGQRQKMEAARLKREETAKKMFKNKDKDWKEIMMEQDKNKNAKK